MNRLRRSLLIPAALVLLVGLAGCHKARVAYAPPPPPPPVMSGTRTNPYPRPAETQPKMTENEGLGEPVSTEFGLASWYGPPYHNRQAADGSVFDQNAMTAAHRELPMGTVVRVTNLQTGDSVVVRITDRGPFIPGRLLDLSMGAAKAISVYRAGVTRVKVEAFAHPASDPAGRWCVQIGVFIDPADAVQLKNDLAGRYRTARVIEFAGPTGHWVRINPANPDRASAKAIADSIHLPDALPYLVRTN